MNTQAQPEIIGVGFGLANIDGTVTIVYVVPGTPASRADLSPGLIVQKIDEVATNGMQEKDWRQKLRGEVGTKVSLVVTTPAKDQTSLVELVRESFILPAELPASAVLRT